LPDDALKIVMRGTDDGFRVAIELALFAGPAAPGDSVNNDMWGDGQLSDRAQGGADMFVFKDVGSMTVGTFNTIEDFSQSQQDKIEFSGVAGSTYSPQLRELADGE
jgi:hypothetical protein